MHGPHARTKTFSHRHVPLTILPAHVYQNCLHSPSPPPNPPPFLPLFLSPSLIILLLFHNSPRGTSAKRLLSLSLSLSIPLPHTTDLEAGKCKGTLKEKKKMEKNTSRQASAKRCGNSRSFAKFSTRPDSPHWSAPL